MTTHRNEVLRIFAAAEREAYARGWRDAIEAVLKSTEALGEPSPPRPWKSEFETSDETDRSTRAGMRDAGLRRARDGDDSPIHPLFGTDNPFRKAE